MEGEGEEQRRHRAAVGCSRRRARALPTSRVTSSPPCSPAAACGAARPSGTADFGDSQTPPPSPRAPTTSSLRSRSPSAASSNLSRVRRRARTARARLGVEAAARGEREQLELGVGGAPHAAAHLRALAPAARPSRAGAARSGGERRAPKSAPQRRASSSWPHSYERAGGTAQRHLERRRAPLELEASVVELIHLGVGAAEAREPTDLVVRHSVHLVAIRADRRGVVAVRRALHVRRLDAADAAQPHPPAALLVRAESSRDA